MLHSLRLVLVTILLLSSGIARSATPQIHLRALLAHPETPVVSLNFRNTLRASVGVTIPVLLEDENQGWGFYVPALVELHNGPGSDQGLPNENWRAFLALDATYRAYFDNPRLRRIDIGIAVQHQSDHHTGRDNGGLGQLQINDIRVRTELLMPVGANAGFLLAGEVRALGVSCTREYQCGTFLGDFSFGGALDLMFDLHADDPTFQGWSWYASIHGGGIVPNKLVIKEQRLIILTGARHVGPLGQWQLFATFWYGNAVGINRFETVLQGGGGFRWNY